MSSGLYSHTTRGTGTVLTAAIYNADHQNHITNQNPSQTGGYADNVAQFQTMTDPGGVGSESLPASLAGELERLRFAINRIVGGPQWYSAPPFDLTDITAPAAPTITTLTANRAGADVSTAQNIFAAAQDTFTAVAAKTYEMEAVYCINRSAGVVSHTSSILLGGTATFTSIGYSVACLQTEVSVGDNIPFFVGEAQTSTLIRAWVISAGAVIIGGTSISATEKLIIECRGLIRVSAGGTIIPQFKYSAAPGGAPTFVQNSFFKMTEVGADTVAAVGAWG